MRQFFLLTIFLAALKVAAQHEAVKTPYDDFVKRFNAKMDTVQWLCQYDNIAWWTSDSVSASSKEEQSKLGSEWFCFLDNSIWHAVYGRFRSDNFEMVYHYEVDSNNLIRRVSDKIDTSITNSYARSLVRANAQLKAYPDTVRVHCNQYIKRNSDKSFSVWFLPAFTTNSIAIYGGEFYYRFDSTGNNITAKMEYSQGYRGFKPDKKMEIQLDYTNLDEPSLGGIFFVWYYRKYFDRIILTSKKFNSAVFHDEPNTYYWIHDSKN